MSHSTTNFADIIAEEQKLAALEYQNDAWAGAISEGIEPEILANAAFDTALRHLLKIHNEKHVFHLLEAMKEKIMMGEFSDHKTIQ